MLGVIQEQFLSLSQAACRTNVPDKANPYP